MSQWKVLVTDKLGESGVSLLSEAAQTDYRPGISPDELLEIIESYDALVVRGRTKATAEVIAAGKNLKAIGRAGVGVDNIDLDAAKTQGVTVVNTPESTSIAVAEHTMALMLALVRHVARADATMKAGQWVKKELQGAELCGKTLGVIGFGNIGSAVAHRAAAFGMKILAFDLDVELIRKVDFAELVSLEDLFARSDVITVHVPLTPGTRDLIGEAAIAGMKSGAYLVCAARGGVVDEAALLAALESGKVAGAALDVFVEEPPGLTVLVAHPHVVASPHIGAQTAEAQTRAAIDVAEEVLNVLKSEPLRWKIV